MFRSPGRPLPPKPDDLDGFEPEGDADEVPAEQRKIDSQVAPPHPPTALVAHPPPLPHPPLHPRPPPPPPATLLSPLLANERSGLHHSPARPASPSQKLAWNEQLTECFVFGETTVKAMGAAMNDFELKSHPAVGQSDPVEELINVFNGKGKDNLATMLSNVALLEEANKLYKATVDVYGKRPFMKVPTEATLRMFYQIRCQQAHDDAMQRRWRLKVRLPPAAATTSRPPTPPPLHPLPTPRPILLRRLALPAPIIRLPTISHLISLPVSQVGDASVIMCPLNEEIHVAKTIVERGVETASNVSRAYIGTPLDLAPPAFTVPPRAGRHRRRRQDGQNRGQRRGQGAHAAGLPLAAGRVWQRHHPHLQEARHGQARHVRRVPALLHQRQAQALRGPRDERARVRLRLGVRTHRLHQALRRVVRHRSAFGAPRRPLPFLPLPPSPLALLASPPTPPSTLPPLLPLSAVTRDSYVCAQDLLTARVPSQSSAMFVANGDVLSGNRNVFKRLGALAKMFASLLVKTKGMASLDSFDAENFPEHETLKELLLFAGLDKDDQRDSTGKFLAAQDFFQNVGKVSAAHKHFELLAGLSAHGAGSSSI